MWRHHMKRVKNADDAAILAMNEVQYISDKLVEVGNIIWKIWYENKYW